MTRASAAALMRLMKRHGQRVAVQTPAARGYKPVTTRDLQLATLDRVYKDSKSPEPTIALFQGDSREDGSQVAGLRRRCREECCQASGPGHTSIPMIQWVPSRPPSVDDGLGVVLQKGATLSSSGRHMIWRTD